MKQIIVLILIPLIYQSCFNHQKKHVDNKEVNKIVSDTIVLKKDVSDKIAGSAYMKRATGYSTIVNRDTSDFMIIFSEGKDDGKVNIGIHYANYNRKGKLIRTRFKEFRRILAIAKTDYNLDSLTTIDIGRLVTTGDLAVEISSDYFKKFGNDFQISDYKKISDFLLGSKLAQDFNELFKDYSKQVERVEIKKVFFTSKKDLYYSSFIEADSSNIPDKIIDCMTWLKMKAKKE